MSIPLPSTTVPPLSTTVPPLSTADPPGTTAPLSAVSTSGAAILAADGRGRPEPAAAVPSVFDRPVLLQDATRRHGDHHLTSVVGPPRWCADPGHQVPSLAVPDTGVAHECLAAGVQARTSIPQAPHITAGFGPEGAPASGTLYGGVDGALFHGSSLWPPPASDAAPSVAAPAAFGTAEFQPKGYKLDFTTYDGSVDPLNWLTHCEQFFWGQRTPVAQWTWMASYHLTGVAQTWFYALLLDEGMPSWERFKELCRLRFGPPIYGSWLAELGRLSFHSTVQEFADRFQTILAHSRDISTRQKVELFVGGLLEHIRVDVAMRALPDLQSAMFLARAFESRATATAALQQSPQPRDARPPPRPALPTRPQGTAAGPTVAPGVPAPSAAGAALAAPGAAAPARPFRRLSPAEMQERRRQGLCYNWIRTYHTMLLPVMIKGERLLALLDTSSTHTFLQGAAMRRLGLAPQGGDQRRVTVASSERVSCEGIARDVPVIISGAPFSITCVGLALGCFDFILGVDFLGTLGPLTWDFEGLTVSFQRDGRRVTWQCVGAPGAPSQQRSLAAVATDPQQPLLDELLLQHSAVFDTPRGLPPARPYDHRIHLLSGTAPADGSWRFCIDYRALNDRTSKDKFPIPVVDELLDGLHGAKFFTKLDLRSGYHQVQMRPADVEKTAFRTHHGHFEFLVTPFGLSNAPATFQVLMNDVLRPFLRRFVLVFFNDILIYSLSWTEHLRHMGLVFTALRAHDLFLKRSKCSFGALSVTCLGHVISADGFAMDSDKVAAVASWPTPRSPRGVRGFLGLAGYYRKFIRDFGSIAAPLTRLLRKEAFV
ncbi:uncharacterized protein [Miscanthus floridulus]|uniref:uncharacterized protein n=1 Tax=Miscanthus floridulus TaxID=154761 RepID=UPI003459F513